MSRSVDVLVTLDLEVARAGGESYPAGRYLIKARDAVADLIEAGERLTAAFRALGESRDISTQVMRHRECESAMVSFDAALVRVKGGAA